MNEVIVIMKAVRMYDICDLRLEEVDIPKISNDEVLLKVIACGICGSDIPRVNKYGAHISPLTIGHEFSAKVVDIGNNVEEFKADDIVVAAPLIPCYTCKWCRKGLYSLCEDYNYFGSRRDGAMAEYISSPKENLIKIDSSIDPIEAATFDPCANAIHGLDIANMKKGETVCIYGVGAIGLFALQCAKAFGASKVIAVDINEKKLEIAETVGADVVINSMNANAPELIKDITGGGTDVVLDITGVPSAQLNSIESADKMGRIVLLGISHRGLNFSEKHVDDIMRRQLSILGSWNSFTKPFPGSDWFKTHELFKDKKIYGEPVISHRLKLEEIPGIFKEIGKGGLFFNKILALP